MSSSPFSPKNRLEGFFGTEDREEDDTEPIQSMAALESENMAAVKSEVAKLEREVCELIRYDRRRMIALIVTTAGLICLAEVLEDKTSHEKPHPQVEVLPFDEARPQGAASEKGALSEPSESKGIDRSGSRKRGLKGAAML